MTVVTMKRVELTCLIEAHIHNDGCYLATEEHTEDVLVCGREEHEHTDACFDAPPGADKEFFCGRIEHTHSEEQHCYFEDGTLRCTIPVHEHTLACRSDPEADVESPAYWEAAFNNVVLTGDHGIDTLNIAKTQLGYTESERNYSVQADGKTVKGYTRYGDWCGIPYGDWSAMFCSFCLSYAGVDEDLVPREADCANWVRLLSDEEYDLYHTVGAYEPKPGDLVFFDTEEALPEEADHAGIVAEIHGATAEEPAQLRTIEGDSDDQVRYVTYDLDDETILGFGSLPGNEERISDAWAELMRSFGLFEDRGEPQTIVSRPAADGAAAVISGILSKNAEAVIDAVPLSEEELGAYIGEETARSVFRVVT